MEMANLVFEIRPSSAAAGIFTSTWGIAGSAGKFSLAIPTSLYFLRSLVISTQWLSSSLNLISPSGSKRTSSSSFFAGMVPAPSFFTLASQEVRTLNSRSVAVIVRRLPLASTSKFERMGIVVLRSTTPWVVVSSFNSADFVTLNSMDWLSSRTVPVAVISQEPFLGTQLYWPLLYSLFALLKRPWNEFALWKWLEMWRVPVPHRSLGRPRNSQEQAY